MKGKSDILKKMSMSTSPKKKKGATRPSLVILSTVDQPTPYQLKKFSLKEHVPDYFTAGANDHDTKDRGIDLLFDNDEPYPAEFNGFDNEINDEKNNYANKSDLYDSPIKSQRSAKTKPQKDKSSDNRLPSPKTSPSKSKIPKIAKKSPVINSEDEYSSDEDDFAGVPSKSQSIKPPPMMQNVPKFEQKKRNKPVQSREAKIEDISSFLANLDKRLREFAINSIKSTDFKPENYIWLASVWAYCFDDKHYKKLNEILEILANNPNDLDSYDFGNVARSAYDLKNMGVELGDSAIIQSNYAIKGPGNSGKTTYVIDSALQYLAYAAAAQDYRQLFVTSFDYSALPKDQSLWTLYNYIVDRTISGLSCQIPDLSNYIASIRRAFGMIADGVKPNIPQRPRTPPQIDESLKKLQILLNDIDSLAKNDESEFLNTIFRLPRLVGEIFNFTRFCEIADNVDQLNFDIHTEDGYENPLNMMIDALNEVEYIATGSGDVFANLANAKNILKLKSLDGEKKRVKHYEEGDIFDALRSPGDLGSSAPSVATSAFSTLVDDETMKGRFVNHLNDDNVEFAESFYDGCDDQGKRHLSRVARLQSAHKQSWLTSVWRLYDPTLKNDDELTALFRYHAHADDVEPLDGGLIGAARSTLRKFMRTEGGLSFFVRAVITGPPKSGKTTFIRTVLMRHFTDLVTSGAFKSTFVVSLDFKSMPRAPTFSDIYQFFSRATVRSLEVQRADIGPYLPSIAKAFENVESGARPKLPKPLTIQNYMRRPLRDLETLLGLIYDANKESKAKFIRMAAEIPARVSDIFSFANCLVIADHLGDSDFEVKDEEEIVNILALTKKLMSRTQFVAAMDVKNCHERLQAIDLEDIDLSHSCEIISIGGVCAPGNHSDISVKFADGNQLRITAQDAGGFPAYVHMFEEAIKEIQAADSALGQKKVASTVMNLIQTLFDVPEDKRIEIESCSVVMAKN